MNLHIEEFQRDNSEVGDSIMVIMIVAVAIIVFSVIYLVLKETINHFKKY